MQYLSLFLLFGVCLKAMTLQESISYALKHNNDLKSQNLSIDMSKSIRDSKKATKYGRVDMIASYDHYNNARTLSPLTPMAIVGSPDGAYKIPATNDMFSVGVAYNVTLFDGFAQRSAYEISDLQYQSSAIKTHLGREEVIYNVKNIYLSILALEELLEAQKIYTEAQKSFSQKIQKEFELGSKSKLDFLKTQTSVEASRFKEESLKSNISILKATLSALMGSKKFDKTEPIDILVVKESFLDGISKKEIISLDRYKATQINIRASEKKRKQVKSTYYPHIDFSAYYGQNFGPNDTKNTVPPTNSAATAGQTLIDEGDWNHEANWQVGLHLKYNIFDFGQKSALNEEARIGILKAKLQSNGVEIELRKNIITAQNKIKLAIAQYNNAYKQYELLNETLKIEQVSYDNGASSLTDLLDTRAKKELSYAQVIDAKYNYQKAKYYLDYLLEKGEVK
jgi:outer membrane protein TolC